MDEREALYAQARAALLEQRAEASEAMARELVGRAPENANARVHLGHSLMMQGRWAEGWPLLEWRRSRRKMLARNLPYPEWSGEPLAGRSILVWGEQGLGDEIQMGRFLPLLRQRGAGHITVAGREQLARIFPLLGANAVLGRSADQIVVPRHDAWVMLGSLPHRLGIVPASLDGRPYLSATSMGGGGIGIVERGNPQHPHDPHRSLSPGALRAVVPDARAMEPQGDLLDSLAQLARLDLLITVDTSWAHMAGALGVPVWILLPFRGLDWRWMRERSDTPWYRSARLFRQARPDDWTEVLDAVRAAVA